MSYIKKQFIKSLNIVFIIGIHLSSVYSFADQNSLTHKKLGDSHLTPVRWSAGCGIDSLYLGLKLTGVDADYFDLIEKAKIEESGQWTSLSTLWSVAREIGVNAKAIEIEGREEKYLKKFLLDNSCRTAILHLKSYKDQPEHLACAYLSKNGKIRILGDMSFQIDIRENWHKRWSGIALVLSRKPFKGTGLEGKYAPRIFIDSKVFDAGNVPNGSSYEYSFTLQNKGNAVLNIKDVVHSCACSKVSFSSKTVFPGSSITLTGSTSVGNRTGPRKTIMRIISDDPETPCLEVVLKCLVESPVIEVQPSSLKFSDIFPGGKSSATVILNFREEALSQTSDIQITSDYKWIDWKLSHDKKRLEIIVSPAWTSGERKGSLELNEKTSSNRLVLPLTAEVKSPEPLLIIKPDKLFCLIDSNKYFSKRISVKPFDKDKLCKILRYELQGFPGEIKIIEDKIIKNACYIDVKLGPFKDLSGFIKGYIILDVEQEGTKRVKIPIFVNRLLKKVGELNGGHRNVN